MLSWRQRMVLSSLAWLPRKSWVRPMDIGASDGSHHSDTLRGLAKLGLVERKKLHAIYCCFGTHHVVNAQGKVVRIKKAIQLCRCKGSCRYRATVMGREVGRSQ